MFGSKNKKMKTKLFSCLLLSGLFFSCQKEVSLENSSGNGGGTGGGGINTGACKDCIYFPMCDGSWYTYDVLLGGTTQVVTDTFRYVKDTTIGNLVFKKMLSAAQKTYSYQNCTNGASRSINYNAVSAGGTTVSKIDITPLKANLPVNGTWTDTITNGAGQAVLYNYTLKEKGVSRTVNGKVFPDVIHVYFETGIDLPLFGFFVTNTSDYYYAKGVGFIESEIKDALSGTVIQQQFIKAWFVP
jgi:hypothetical protein